MAALFSRGKKQTAPFCSVVVAAAGSSTRMGGEDKLLLPLGGIPVLVQTLMALEQCRSIHEIVVVVRGESIPLTASLCRDFGIAKVSKIVAGGDTRTASVLHGVSECSPQTQLIAIHDGARPLVSDDVLEQVIATALETGAAAPAVPVKDTIKQTEHGKVTATPERASLFAVQTPQVFEPSLIKAALTRAEADGAALTDDCAAVERLGMTVTLTRGSDENIKITTPVDMVMAEAILAWREQA